MSEARRIELGSHGLQCEVGGEGERHFLCLHGLVDSLEIWQKLTPKLEQRGRVCRIDQRGHGRSDAPAGPYSRADLAADVVGALDSEGVDRSILVGHSMGGIVAMATALLHPARVAGLVLIGTTSQCKEKVAGWYERIALAGESEGCEGLARAIYGEKSQKQVVGDAQGIAHVTRMLKSLFDDPLTPTLEQIACPVLLLVGEKDPMGPKASEIIHAALPTEIGQLELIPGKGHWLHVDSAEQVGELLDPWLEKLP
jgi:pimeloyl-ACP methyl ester carboxylesterase